MVSNSKLKKEGIEVKQKLDTLKVNTVANNIANKLCFAFPEHNLNKSDLFECISRINMYFAKMPLDSSYAKYFYKYNSIYFNENIDLDDLPTLVVHECIHCIQELYDKNNNLLRMGLYTPSNNKGLGINEAAVQLMASEANSSNPESEIYFGITLNTISPNYYPLECALLNQITYFTGTYPLYHSVLNSNDVFKNTLSAKIGEKNYSIILKKFDKLLSLENNLNYYVSELQYTEKINSIKLLNELIDETKKEIKSLFFKTQNLIMNKCFKSEFNSIRNLDDIKDFNKKLYNYKDIIGTAEGYTFYNDFYRNIMNSIEEKKAYIEANGEINLFENINTSLILIDETQKTFSLINTLILKIRKLFKLNNNSYEDINNLQ